MAYITDEISLRFTKNAMGAALQVAEQVLSMLEIERIQGPRVVWEGLPSPARTLRPHAVRREQMTATQVRRLPDGEELVLVEGQETSPASSNPDPREAAFERRSQAMSDDRRDS